MHITGPFNNMSTFTVQTHIDKNTPLNLLLSGRVRGCTDVFQRSDTFFSVWTCSHSCRKYKPLMPAALKSSSIDVNICLPLLPLSSSSKVVVNHKPEMSFHCLRSKDPNVTMVDVVYEANNDDSNLYTGNGNVPPCSTITPSPSLSDCMVCTDQSVYAVCSEKLKNATLVMEGDDRNIPISVSDCPKFLESGTGTPWLLFLIVVFLLIAVLMVVCAHRKKKGPQRT
ncbi:uncharacterized protein V6R79_018794 [Siganus canaliculatus]